MKCWAKKLDDDTSVTVVDNNECTTSIEFVDEALWKSPVDIAKDGLESLILLTVERYSLFAGLRVHRRLVGVILADVDVRLSFEFTHL